MKHKFKINSLLIVFVVILCGFSFIGCGSNVQQVDVDNLKTQIEELQKENEKLKNEIDKDSHIEKEEFSEPSNIQNSKKAEEKSNNKFDFIKVNVIKLNKLEVNYDASRYSPRVEFEFEITNNSDKDIRGISGELDICDLFSKSIVKFQLDFTQDIIPANSTVTVKDLGFDVNKFKDDHVKVYNSSFDTLIFKYTTEEVIY